ncbi:DNA replication complex GINS protein PSF3, partial [Armadillidium vulgare]
MDWCESYSPNYFTIEDILATQERIPCKFELPVYNLGYLDQSGGSNDILPGTKLELPCWMSRALCSSKRHIVSAQLPLTSKKIQEILKADPNVVDLHKLGPYFYEVGQHLLPLAGKDSGQLALLLAQTLRERLRKIMDAALHSLADDVSNYIKQMDELERTLFKIGQLSLRDHELWLARKSHLLTASSHVYY